MSKKSEQEQEKLERILLAQHCAIKVYSLEKEEQNRIIRKLPITTLENKLLSGFNHWLLQMQSLYRDLPYFSKISDYMGWKKEGRMVKHGEKGLVLMTRQIPLESVENINIFRNNVFFVWDISQTEIDEQAREEYISILNRHRNKT